MKKYLRSKRTFLLLSMVFPVFGTTLLITYIRLNQSLLTPQSQTEKVTEALSESFFPGKSLHFIANEGQVDGDAQYHVQGAGHTVLFEQRQIVLRRIEEVNRKNEILIRFEGANQHPEITAGEKLKSVAHFYKDPNPDNWKTNVPTYASIRYTELYPGVDMVYTGEEGILESEFHVAPQVDYRQIKLNYKGIKSKRIREDGALVFETTLGELVELPPYVYQQIDGEVIPVKAGYKMLADATIGFDIGKYNLDYTLVIDPELIFLTTVQGFGGEWSTGIAFDEDDNLVMVGAANRFFQAMDTIPESNHAEGLGNDGWLVKMDGNTGEVIYSALFGGTKNDVFQAITIDSSGNLYLTGFTASTDFPLLNPAQDTLTGNDDAFLTIFNAEGELSYSSYLGGSGRDIGEGIALDGTGNFYIAGHTRSDDFPVIGGVQDTYQGTGEEYDIFVAKYNSSGNVDYSTYLGGSAYEYLGGIAVNSSGSVTIAGQTLSDDFPIMNAYQGTYMGGSDAFEGDIFVSTINSDGSTLVYSTYYGGTDYDWSTDVSLDLVGNAFVTGGTSSDDFPVIGGSAFPETDSSDGVLFSLSTTGQPVYSLRSNIPGSESFDAIEIADTISTLVFGSWDTKFKVFEKSDDSLALFYEENMELTDINATDFSAGYLAFTGTYWPPDFEIVEGAKPSSGTNSKSFHSEVIAGMLRITDLYEFGIDDTDGENFFYVEFNGSNSEGLKLDVNVEGYITINGESTGILAEDIEDMAVWGSEGNDLIDLSEVTKVKFPFIDEDDGITVFAEDGDNTIIGSPDYSNDIFSGSGKDDITAGSKADNIYAGGGNDIVKAGDGDDFVNGEAGDDNLHGEGGNDVLNGGDGNDGLDGGSGNDGLAGDKGKDTYFGGLGNDAILFSPIDPIVNGGLGDDYYQSFGKEVESPIGDDIKSIPSSKSKSSTAIDSNAVNLIDMNGIDTLDFSEYKSNVTLSLVYIGGKQVIDTSGSEYILDGIFEGVIGSDFEDVFSVSPLSDTVRFIDGKGGTDVLHYYTSNPEAFDDGSSITTNGFADVEHVNIETVNLFTESAPNGVSSQNESMITLVNFYPNPFSSSTKINYTLYESSEVKLDIYSSTGRLITTLVKGTQPQGSYNVEWNVQKIPGTKPKAGIYIYIFEINDILYSGKLILRK